MAKNSHSGGIGARRLALLAASASVLALAFVGEARAQDASSGIDETAFPAHATGDIIVTARKREEALTETPVVIQAFSGEQLEKLAITDTTQLATITPGLRLNYGTGGVGATAFLRGIGNGDAATFIDQSVLLNVDGVPLSHGAFYKSGLFDMAQVEVLKGPQSLFFGKSASAGIISVTTADPTDEFETQVKAGYGFEFDEKYVEGIVSGPLSDNLGARISAFYSDEDGYLKNLYPGATTRTEPNGDEFGIRGTLKFDSGTGLKVRAKYTYFQSRDLGNIAGSNQYICAGAVPQKSLSAPYDNCTIDDTVRGAPAPGIYDPVNNYLTVTGLIGQTPSELGFGKAIYNVTTHQGSVQIDWEGDNITATSVTGYSHAHSVDTQRVVQAVDIGGFVDVDSDFTKEDFSQELRISSDFSGPFNFLAGMFYSTGTTDYRAILGFPLMPDFPQFGLLGPNYADNRLVLKDEVMSAFAQFEFALTPTIDISAGGRYTWVKKYWKSLFNRDEFANPANDFFGPDGEQIGLLNPSDRAYDEDNFSPEVTVRFRPTDDFMAYAAYKRGYKGPGFNGATTAYSQSPLFGTVNSPFAGEKVEGGEIGAKGSLADNQLTFTSAAYWYKYKGLQISFVENTTFQFTTRNGADAIVRGVELGTTFAPRAVDGLSLNAFVNYNDAYYDSFPEATCYTGQTAAQGCVGGVQDLSGRQLHRSPKWSGMFGGSYDTAIGSGLVGGLTVNSNFASNTNITPEQVPVGKQGSYITFDATLNLGAESDAWNIAVIGRNLTDEIYAFSGLDAGFGDFGMTGPNGPDVLAYVNRGRSIMLQLTIKPNLF